MNHLYKIIFLSLIGFSSTFYPTSVTARGEMEHHRPEVHRQMGGERGMEHRNAEMDHPAARGFERGVEAGASSDNGASVVTPVYDVDPTNPAPPEEGS